MKLCFQNNCILMVVQTRLAEKYIFSKIMYSIFGINFYKIDAFDTVTLRRQQPWIVGICWKGECCSFSQQNSTSVLPFSQACGKATEIFFNWTGIKETFYSSSVQVLFLGTAPSVLVLWGAGHVQPDFRNEKAVAKGKGCQGTCKLWESRCRM